MSYRGLTLYGLTSYSRKFLFASQFICMPKYFHREIHNILPVIVLATVELLMPPGGQSNTMSCLVNNHKVALHTLASFMTGTAHDCNC